jgi:hypothetical protein
VTEGGKEERILEPDIIPLNGGVSLLLMLQCGRNPITSRPINLAEQKSPSSDDLDYHDWV